MREDAIVDTVNRLLAEKGYDAMTVDQVAADVGIAKASLYKHFSSKEALAAAAMVRVLQRTLQRLQTLGTTTPIDPLARLKAMVAWAMQLQLAGEMPTLPAQNSALRAALSQHRGYLDLLIEVSEVLGEWITAAQASGQLSGKLPPELVLYTLYARACDPVLGVLQASGHYSDEEVIALILASCFDGLCAR